MGVPENNGMAEAYRNQSTLLRQGLNNGLTTEPGQGTQEDIGSLGWERERVGHAFLADRPAKEEETGLSRKE